MAKKGESRKVPADGALVGPKPTDTRILRKGKISYPTTPTKKKK